MTEQEIMRAATDKWGVASQLDMVVEELAELIVAIKHRIRGRVEVAKVIEEVADVSLSIKSLKMIMGISDEEVAVVERQKLARVVILLEESKEGVK